MRAILLRSTTVGLVAAIGTMLALTACSGNAPAPTPTGDTPVGDTSAVTVPAAPVAGMRKYTTSTLEIALIGSTVAGKSILNAYCTDATVTADGTGTYSCQLNYSDGSYKVDTVTVKEDGTASVPTT